MNRQCSPKTKILVYQNGYTKTFFINKMTIYNIIKNDGKTEIYQYNKEEYDKEEYEEESMKKSMMKKSLMKKSMMKKSLTKKSLMKMIKIVMMKTLCLH